MGFLLQLLKTVKCVILKLLSLLESYIIPSRVLQSSFIFFTICPSYSCFWFLIADCDILTNVMNKQLLLLISMPLTCVIWGQLWNQFLPSNAVIFVDKNWVYHQRIGSSLIKLVLVSSYEQLQRPPTYPYQCNLSMFLKKTLERVEYLL